MSAPMPVTRTFDESISLLAQIAKERGSDNFRIKIYRRSSPAAPMDSVAILDGAKVEHLTTPESWLVPLCGGGPFFIISAYHADALGETPVTLVPPMINAPVTPVNEDAVKAPDWTGPTTLVYALNKAPKAPAPAPRVVSLYGEPPPGNGGAGSEPAPRTQTQPPVAAVPGSSLPVFDERLALARISEDRERLREERHRMELEAVKRESDAQLRRLEQKLADLAQRPVVEPKPIMEQLAPLAALVAPIFAQMREQAAADRRFQAELEAKREEREAANRREAAEREERRREEAAKERQAMLDRISAQSGDAAKANASNMEAVSMMARTMVQTIASTQELLSNAQPPPPDEGLMGMLKAGLLAFGEYQASSRLAQMEAAAARQPQAPRLAGAKPQQPVKPPPGPPVPPPPGGAPPAPAPVDPALVAASTDAEEDEEETVDVTQADPQEVIDMVTTALMGHHDAQEVATFYLDALANPGVQAVIQQAGGTLPFFQQRLGAGWVDQPENFEYISKVLGVLQTEAKQRGLV